MTSQNPKHKTKPKQKSSEELAEEEEEFMGDVVQKNRAINQEKF